MRVIFIAQQAFSEGHLHAVRQDSDGWPGWRSRDRIAVFSRVLDPIDIHSLLPYVCQPYSSYVDLRLAHKQHKHVRKLWHTHTKYVAGNPEAIKSDGLHVLWPWTQCPLANNYYQVRKVNWTFSISSEPELFAQLSMAAVGWCGKTFGTGVSRVLLLSSSFLSKTEALTVHPLWKLLHLCI